MGLFSSIGNFFTGDDSGQDAANAIAAANALANEGLETQFGETKANLDPFIAAGEGGLDRSESASTPQGFADLLGQIFDSDIFKRLREERIGDVRGQLAATGQSRSGGALETIADIPTQIGLAIEQLLSGRSGALATQGLGAGINLGNFGQTKAQNVAGIQQSTGAAQGQGIIRDANSSAFGFGNILSSIGKVGGALSGAGVFGSGTLGSIASGIFSDRRLKTNVRIVGRNGPLKVHEWDWVPEAKGTIIELCPTEGFMSDEVRQIYPEHVHSFGGFDVLDYESIEKELRAA